MARLILLILLIPLASADEFTALIDQLGHRTYKKREEASRQLFRSGSKYFKRLEKQVNHSCPETRHRVRAILNGLTKDLPVRFFIHDDRLWEMKKQSIIDKFNGADFTVARKIIWKELLDARIRPRKCADLILKLRLAINGETITQDDDWQPVETLGQAARLQWLEHSHKPNPYLKEILDGVNEYRWNEWRVLAALRGIHTTEVYDTLVDNSLDGNSLYVHNNKDDAWDCSKGLLNPMVIRILQGFPAWFHVRSAILNRDDWDRVKKICWIPFTKTRPIWWYRRMVEQDQEK